MHLLRIPLLAFVVLWLLSAQAQTSPAVVVPGETWTAATPAEAGMDPLALATMLEFGANVQMDSLFVARHGKVVVDAYYAPFARGMKHRINSATKAVVGALTGIAIDRGVLPATDAALLPLFGQREIANLDEHKRAVTLQTLLDMTSGLEWTEPLHGDAGAQSMIAAERSGDWLRYILNQPMAQAPGASFNYSSGNSHLLSALIMQRSNMPTQAFAQRHLFAPIGIKAYRWRQDPQGVAVGGYGLYLAPPDMARLGQLYLQRGQWNGRQVIPAAWVDRVFNASVPMNAGGQWLYADGWWVRPDRKAYLMVGQFRQLVIVLPDLGIVAAATGRFHYPIENLLDHLRRAAAASSAPDAQASLGVQQAIARYASEPSRAVALPAKATEVSGRRFKLAANDFGWNEVMIQFGDKPTYEVMLSLPPTGRIVRSVRPVGVDGRYVTTVMPDGVVLSNKAEWMDENRLRITVRLPEETATLLYDIRFEGDRIEIVSTDASGARKTVTGERVR
jgi:CubicO group peptidase (beta-lactamase class C family)